MGTNLRPLPTTPEELAEGGWLAEALRAGGVLEEGQTMRVTGVEPVGEGAAFACKLFRLTLDGPAEAPASVIAKLPVTGEARAMLDGIGAYGREVLFYRTLAETVPVRTPRCYVAEQDDDSSDFVLVIEDLAGKQAIDQLEGLTRRQAEAVTDELARFHAWSWAIPERLEACEASFWPMDSPAGRAVQEQFAQLFGMVWETRRREFGELLDADGLAIGDRFVTLLDHFITELSAPRAITHGELRADNLFFDGDQPILFDFQVAQQEAGVRELAYLLTTSMTVEDADALEAGLVRRYWEGLCAAGVANYPFGRAQEQYRVAVAYNLLWPVMASMRWEASSERGRAVLDDMVRRVGAAIARQQSLAVLPAPAG